MNRVKYQKGHPGKESVQQNVLLLSLFSPSSVTRVSVLASQILFQVEKFQAFCFQLPNITMDLRGIKT